MSTKTLCMNSELQFKSSIKDYDSSIIFNPDKVVDSLNILKEFIKNLRDSKYDGFHDGKPGATYTNTRLCHMFDFCVINEFKWTIEIMPTTKYERFDCIQPGKERHSCIIYKEWISLSFHDQLESIDIKDDKIHIMWKQ